MVARCSPYKSNRELIYDVYKSKGIFGFYKGARIQMTRDSIGYGIFFGSYTFIKNQLHSDTTTTPPYSVITISGMLSGILFYSVYPIDVIKTKIQS